MLCYLSRGTRKPVGGLRGIIKTDRVVTTNDDHSFVVRPEPQHFNRALRFQYLIHQSVLDIYSPRIGARQVADKLFVGWRVGEGIAPENIKELLRFGLEPNPTKTILRQTWPPTPELQCA